MQVTEWLFGLYNGVATGMAIFLVAAGLILLSVQIETNYPRPSSEAAQTIGVGGEPR